MHNLLHRNTQYLSLNMAPLHRMLVLDQRWCLSHDLLKYPLSKDQTGQMSLFIYSRWRTTTALECVMSLSMVWWQPAASVQSRFGPFVSLIYLSCVCVQRLPVCLAAIICSSTSRDLSVCFLTSASYGLCGKRTPLVNWTVDNNTFEG